MYEALEYLLTGAFGALIFVSLPLRITPLLDALSEANEMQSTNFTVAWVSVAALISLWIALWISESKR